MRAFWNNYNLSIVLLTLFVFSWIGQTLTGWQEFVSEQNQHGEVAQVFGSSGYVWRWSEATLENWQSEFLQLLTMVVLTSFLIHKGSAESRDSQDHMQRQLERIEKQLADITSSGKPSPKTNSNGKKSTSKKKKATRPKARSK